MSAVGLAAALIVSGWSGTQSATAATPAQLGRSAEHAAVSCWDIKQQAPSSTDGTYWLLTPLLRTPREFHCDMTTDGGGWVLVARGRQGWSFAHDGQGTPDQVRSVVEGSGAFVPRALSAELIDGLLNGTRVDQLSEGVRLRRSTNTSGSTRQEATLRFAKRDRWSWALGADHPLAGYRFDTRSYSGGRSADFGSDQSYRRVQTIAQESQGWNAGWSFGRFVGGSTSATSHLWSSAGRNAMPFTQVYLRPRLTAANTSFPAVPDTGAPASTQPPVASDLALPAPWGVTGLANGRTGELDTEAQAFAQSGNRMIVGGNFRYVQRGDGGERVSQSYLAAFDVTTGEWLPDFRPVLNGQVKALHTLANGSVVVGGEFTTVNGAPAAGMIALDPVSGAADARFTVAVENRISGQAVAVTTFDAEGPWLYLGGRFTHIAGGRRSNPAYTRMAARVDRADGTPDGNWNPNLDGSVTDLDASARGDRVYLAGYFDTANGVSTPRVAVVGTGAGAALVPGLGRPSFSSTTNYQQAILEVGDRLWHGGAQHLLFSYRRADLARLSGNITLEGGDFQVLHDRQGIVYGGCHCNNYNYSEAYSFPNVGTSWTQGDDIGFLGAWDGATGAYLPSFRPELRAARGAGVWAVATDSNGALWMGGDFDRARAVGGTMQWVGGFVRFAGGDGVAPSVPSGGLRSDSGGSTNLAWRASTDDRGGVDYEILRNDRVVATTAERQVTIAATTAADRFFVRAVDRSGNRSATTPVLRVPAPK